MRDLNQKEIEMVDGAGIVEAWEKLKDTAEKAWEGVKDAIKKL